PSIHNSTTIMNGKRSHETRVSWRFQAERMGKFIIPGRTYEIDDKRVHINDVSVEVEEMPAEMRRLFFLRWKAPEGPFYVGQAIPVTLQLFVRSGIAASLNSVPEGQ